MISIPLNDPPEAKDRHRTALLIGVIISLLLHLAPVVLLLVPGLWSPSIPEPKPEFVMEMVPLPETKPPPPPPPQPSPVPEPERRLLPPPPAPQFTEAPIAEESTPPPAPVPSRQPARPAVVPGGALMPSPPKPTPVPPASARPEALPVPEEKFSARGRLDTGQGSSQQVPATQAFRDFILKQIAQHWLLDLHGPRYSRIVLEGPPIVVLPSGMLASPWGKNDPLDLRRMIRDYDQVVNRSDDMTALVTFLQAMRQAQPFRLPPDGKDGQARVFQLRFTLGDVPQ